MSNIYILKSVFKKVFRFKTVIFFLFAAETSAEFAETETGHTYHTSHYRPVGCTHHGHLALHNSLGDLAGKFSKIFQSTRFFCPDTVWKLLKQNKLFDGINDVIFDDPYLTE